MLVFLSCQLYREGKQAQISPRSPLKQRSPGELKGVEVPLPFPGLKPMEEGCADIRRSQQFPEWLCFPASHPVGVNQARSREEKRCKQAN